jgi:hypothetical protein
MGDARRNQRLNTLLGGIVQGQSARSHGTQGAGANDNWARVMGAHRFFDNEQIPRTTLSEAVATALQAVAAPTGRLYVLHDLSTVDYSKHTRKKDRTQVGNEYGLGYELYTALVLGAKGQVLGPCLYELRTASGVLSSSHWEPLPYTDHYEQVERGTRAARVLFPGRERVHVGDREFDELQWQRWLGAHDEKFILRAKQTGRAVRHHHKPTTLGQAVKTVALTKHRSLVERDGISYEVWRGETRVVFDGMSRRGVKQKRAKPKPGVALEMRVVISELRPQSGKGKPEQWILLTNLEDPLDEIVQGYVWRWKIERFFFLTKMGFRLEEWGQETGDRIARRLGVTMLAAMVVYQLQKEGTAGSEEVVAELASMGGYIVRANRTPGPLVLLRGVMSLLSALSLLERHTKEELQAMAKQAGLPLPKPRRSRPGASKQRNSRPLDDV